MLAREHCSDLFADVELPKHQLLEVKSNKISLHRAKEGYSYPTIRLPHTLSVLAGLPTRVYQTVHKGALAFLVVVAPTDTSNYATDGCENDVASSKSSIFTRRRSRPAIF
jgi:hypothetical protein